MRRAARLARGVLLALMAVVLALLAVEVLLRMRGFDPAGDLGVLRPALIQPSQHASLRYELVPAATAFAWGSQVTINSSGLRGRELDSPKPAGHRRVLVVGDSVTFGIGLADDEPFPARLDAQLARHAIEVVNASVPGYDVVDEVAWLELRGFDLAPDLVLFAYAVNDVGVHSLSLENLEASERFAAPWSRSRLCQWLVQASERAEYSDWHARVNDDEEFARRFASRIRPIAGDADLDAWRRAVARVCSPVDGELPGHPFFGWYASSTKLGRLRWAFERLAAVARERGVIVVVVRLPYPRSAEKPEVYEPVSRILAHECERAGLDLHDPTPALEYGQLAAFDLTERDGLHLNAAAHGWIATDLAPLILARLSR